MFGLSADMDAISKLGIPIIEDCALSIGATYKNRRVGSFGSISVFSFYATKVMTTLEGGLVATDNPRLYVKILDLREYDHKQSYRVRFNYKMSDAQAAMGMVQLSKLGQYIMSRQRLAAMYNNGLNDMDVELPCAGSDKRHIYFRYVIRSSQKADIIIKKLWRAGIEAKRPVHKPLHHYLGLDDYHFPITSEIYKTAVSLPIYPTLKDSQVRFVIGRLKKIYGT
jgi:perosamine synthetase